MKKTTFEDHIPKEIIGDLSFTYQSIEGIVFQDNEKDNISQKPYAKNDKYHTKWFLCRPFYKNITKMYIK